MTTHLSGTISATDLVLPRRLPPGGRIGICAPAGPVQAERLRSAIAALESAGFSVVTSPSVLGRHGIFSASDEVRRRELEEMFTREDIDAVFCARGGVGSSRLLQSLDAELIAKSRKPFLGFSDITALQWMLFRRCRFVTFSGPLAVEWDGAVSVATCCSALSILSGEWSHNLLSGFDSESLHVIRGNGRTEGRLMPANLTMLTTLIGTAFMPDLRGSLLLIEEVGEPLYRVDRMLFHLRHAGVLEELAGLLVGDLGVAEEDREPVNQSLLDATHGYGYPLAVNLPYSHGSNRMTVPVGVPAQFDAGTPALALTITPATSA